jgi:hypothetical protein
MEAIDNFMSKNEHVLTYILTLSHIVIATIFVICLNKNPSLLFILLGAIMGYISYSNMDAIKWYVFPSLGLLLYIADILISKHQYDGVTFLDIVFNTYWRMPYWGIMSYYIYLSYDKLITKN